MQRGCRRQSPDVVGERDGSGVGEIDGNAVGDVVGDVDGYALGDGDGMAEGAAVLSQQLKNNVPPSAGQHMEPGIVKPKLLQRSRSSTAGAIPIEVPRSITHRVQIVREIKVRLCSDPIKSPLNLTPIGFH